MSRHGAAMDAIGGALHASSPDRRWLAMLAGLLLSACSERGVSPPGIDAAIDLPAVTADVSDIGVDASMPLDVGIDVQTPRDDGSTDVVVARDDGARDVATDVRRDAALLDVPVDPTAVPPPGSECTGDAGVRPGDPSIAPPRPILPQSVSRVTSQRPSFRWALPAGTTGARVEVCADRCCTRVITTLDAESTTVRPATALPPGVVYWRMFGRRAGLTGSRASYTWEFEVRRRDTPVDSSWGTIRDFTGDGYDDVLMLSEPFNFAEGTIPLNVAEGGPGGPRAPRLLAMLTVASSSGRVRVGDFNGDGCADIAYFARDRRNVGGVVVVQSAPGVAHRIFTIELSAGDTIMMSSPAVTDWDGDGYSDLVTTHFRRPEGGVAGSAMLVYRGSPTGLALRPQISVQISSPIFGSWIEMGMGLGDLDLDGHGDVLVTDRDNEGRHLGYSLAYGGEGNAFRADTLWSVSPSPGFSIGQARVELVADLDGDQRGDLAVRVLRTPALFVFRRASGLEVPSETLWERPPAGGAGFGAQAEAADLNGDGFADLLVSASDSATETWLETGFPYNSGRMYVHRGSREGVVSDPIWFDRVRPTDPMDNPSSFASTIASPGDLNADGFDDAVIRDSGRRTCCYVMGSADPVGAHLEGCLACPGPGDSY